MQDVVDRFWSRVERSETCWLWVGPGSTYGIFCARNQSHGAHRFSWELHFGPIPKGLFVLHHCDAPRCVRPGHLFLGTQKDNIADARQKGRLATGDRHGLRRHPEARARGERHGTKTQPGSVPKGTSHYATKFMDDDIREIRRLREEEGLLHREIAHRYGVSREAIGVICRRVAWKHV